MPEDTAAFYWLSFARTLIGALRIPIPWRMQW